MSLGVIVILFFLVVPIIITVVSEKSKVMKGFAYITKKEITEIINWASAFDIRSSAKSLKLLAETRKDKVYALMQMQKEKKQAKEEKQQSVEVEKSNKLRTLIRTIFKFEDDVSPPHRRDEEGLEFENSLPAPGEYSGEQLDRIPVEDEDEPDLLGDPVEAKIPIKEPDEPNLNDSKLPLDATAEQKQKHDNDKLLQKRKKQSLAMIE